MAQFKLGRLPRTYDPRVPHHAVLKAMLKAQQLTPLVIPNSHDNSSKLPADLGMMLNDQLGDCSCAAVYHLIQLASNDAQGQLITEPDTVVLDLYREMGYKGGVDASYDAKSDQGCVLQDVLAHLLNQGAPMADGTRHKVLYYAEVDCTNLLDVCEVIYHFGAAYIGFSVPKGFMEDVGRGDNFWDVHYTYGAPVGGHCVILPGYTDAKSAPVFDVISWGQKNIRMSPAFFQKYVDEVYAIVDPLWIKQTGRTPYGIDIATLEAQASALRAA